MAKRAWSEISIDETPSDRTLTSPVTLPTESSEVDAGHRKEEPKQIAETSPNEATSVLELATDITVEVASKEELTAGVFWDLLSRAGYTVW